MFVGVRHIRTDRLLREPSLSLRQSLAYAKKDRVAPGPYRRLVLLVVAYPKTLPLSHKVSGTSRLSQGLCCARLYSPRCQTHPILRSSCPPTNTASKSHEVMTQ